MEVNFKDIFDTYGNCNWNRGSLRIVPSSLSEVKLQLSSVRWSEHSDEPENLSQNSIAVGVVNKTSRYPLNGKITARFKLKHSLEIGVMQGHYKGLPTPLDIPLPNPVVVRFRKSIKVDPSMWRTKESNSVPQQLPYQLPPIEYGSFNGAVLKTRHHRWEGTFTCAVYPVGNVLFEGNGIHTKSVQDVISALKRSNYQNQVRAFIQDADGQYYWVITGFGEFKWEDTPGPRWQAVSVQDNEDSWGCMLL